MASYIALHSYSILIHFKVPDHFLSRIISRTGTDSLQVFRKTMYGVIRTCFIKRKLNSPLTLSLQHAGIPVSQHLVGCLHPGDLC